MAKKQTRYLFSFIIILLIQLSLQAQVSSILIGEEDTWGNSQLINLKIIDGKRGFLDLTNSDNEYKVDKHTDMIFSFNQNDKTDKTGNYYIDNELRLINRDDALGGGSAYFDGSKPLIISFNENSMFSPANVWDDFSLEFRLLPATLKEGSTVFLWKGLYKEGNELIPQEIRCTFTKRKLLWDFENIFLYPETSSERISLSGDKLIPEQWSHHMVTFDSSTGLLEYKINNIPVDNTYTSINKHESNEFSVPIIGNEQSFPIELGRNYMGLIDEFKLSSNVVQSPIMDKYSFSGYLETEIIDLTIPGSELIRIESDYNLPSDTSLQFKYIFGNKESDISAPDALWESFEPSEPLGIKGQYLKVNVRFFSETALNKAPILSNIRIIYKKDSPPPPPMNLRAIRSKTGIEVTWNRSSNPKIMGYLVYFGEEPGQYLSFKSPINAKLENRVLINDVDLNKRYYISVTSYKSLVPKLESVYSEEISISP